MVPWEELLCHSLFFFAGRHMVLGNCTPLRRNVDTESIFTGWFWSNKCRGWAPGFCVHDGAVGSLSSIRAALEAYPGFQTCRDRTFDMVCVRVCVRTVVELLEPALLSYCSWSRGSQLCYSRSTLHWYVPIITAHLFACIVQKVKYTAIAYQHCSPCNVYGSTRMASHGHYRVAIYIQRHSNVMLKVELYPVFQGTRWPPVMASIARDFARDVWTMP